MNIQQIIIEGLREQLYHHQYIVLPEFGGFVLKPRPAHFSASGLQLLPPSKTVSFNSQLRQNDGILTAWLQKRLTCNAEAAFTHLKEFAGYCTGVLQNRRRLSLPGIGFFHLDFENNISFEPLPDHNFLASSFGLTPVNIETEKVPQPARKMVFEDRHFATPTRRPVAARARTAAVPVMLTACVAILLFLLASVSDFRGELRAALSGVNADVNYVPVKYQAMTLAKSEAMPPLVSDAFGIAMLRLDEKNLPVAVNPEENTGRGNYEIVMGCFSVPSNARRMVKKLQGSSIRAHILPEKHRGMQVVAYGAFEHREDAQLALSAIKAVVPGAWIKSR